MSHAPVVLRSPTRRSKFQQSKFLLLSGLLALPLVIGATSADAAKRHQAKKQRVMTLHKKGQGRDASLRRPAARRTTLHKKGQGRDASLRRPAARPMTLHKKGQRRDARSMIKARYAAEQQLHAKRMAIYREKLGENPSEAGRQSVRIELARHEKQMEHLGPQYALATAPDRILIKLRAQAKRRHLRLSSKNDRRHALGNNSRNRPGMKRAAANRAALKRAAANQRAAKQRAAKHKRIRLAE